MVRPSQLQSDHGLDIQWRPVVPERYHARLAGDPARVPADVADCHGAGKAAAPVMPRDCDVDVGNPALDGRISFG
jgi:hypothetical protein